MKKSLVALAVAGVFAAPAAFADVTISGAINMGLSWDRAGNSPGQDDGFSKMTLASNYSLFNISSVDDIGGGNSVVMNIQTAAGLNSTGSTLGNRDSHLGIKGGWGGLYWGTNENIYEQYMYESDPLDGAAGMGGNLQMLGTPGGAVFEVGQNGCAPSDDGGGGCVDFYRRTDDTIWYASPSWGGFSFAVNYTTSSFKNSKGGDSPQVLSLGAQFKPDGGPFFVNIAMERHTDMYGLNQLGGSAIPGEGSQDTGIQAGVGVMFGNVSIFARAERLTYRNNNQTATGDRTEYERDAMWFAGKFGMDSGYVGAALGIADDASCTSVGTGCSADKTGAVMFGLGYFHNLSKQSQMQVIGSMTNNDDNANYLHAGGSNPLGGSSGVTRTGLYLGIKHVF
ncbi:MAG: porin [Betaproteobacteria bacterium]|nr:porin [Betaproteobacteria bacterium]